MNAYFHLLSILKQKRRRSSSSLISDLLTHGASESSFVRCSIFLTILTITRSDKVLALEEELRIGLFWCSQSILKQKRRRRSSFCFMTFDSPRIWKAHLCDAIFSWRLKEGASSDHEEELRGWSYTAFWMQYNEAFRRTSRRVTSIRSLSSLHLYWFPYVSCSGQQYVTGRWDLCSLPLEGSLFVSRSTADNDPFRRSPKRSLIVSNPRQILPWFGASGPLEVIHVHRQFHDSAKSFAVGMRSFW